MKKLLLMFITGVMASVAVGAQAEPFKAILNRAGELSAVLGDQVNVIDAVEVEGPMNDADFNTLCRAGYCGKLQTVDLSAALPEGNKVPACAFWIDLSANPVEGARPRSSINDVILPDQVVEIGELAFNDLKLKDLKLPASLKVIGSHAFANNTDMDMETLTLPAEVEVIGDGAFTYSNFRKVVLPASLKEIGARAFAASQVEEVNLPEGLEVIGSFAFFNSGLKSVTLPASLAALGDGAFASCAALTEAVFPEGMTVIPAQLFENCENLASVNIPSTLETIGESAFGVCVSLDEMTIPAGVTSIGRNAFFRCNFSHVDVLCPVESLSPRLFANMGSLQSATVPDSWESIPEGLFMNCGLTAIDLPSQLKTVGAEAFMGCDKLTEVTLPEGLEEVGASAFSYCSLRKLVLPASVTRLAEASFSMGVRGDVYSFAMVPPVCASQNMLMGAYQNTLYVPAGTKDAYAAAYGWELFGNIAEYDPSAIGETGADGDAAVTVSGGAVVVAGGTFEVYTTDGRLVARGMADGDTAVAVAPGIYVVRVADTACKVAVK